MRIAIIEFPGSNCERETMLAVKRAGMEPHEFLWNEAPEKLRDMQGYIIIGGFSYEDRSRAGIIAALQPIMFEVKAQSELGKPVLGICNGAQILVEAGLVPGAANYKLAMALTENKRILNGKVQGTGYYNAWVHMRLSDEYQRNAFTRHLTPADILSVPVAHGEGRFVMSSALLAEIEMQGLHVFQYCNAKGEIDPEFPHNPNGSTANIAAISNKVGNVMAMMPHPERTHGGDAIFQSMRDYIAEGRVESVAPLYYHPRHSALKTYQCDNKHQEFIIELMITDNEALTVQHTLRQLGLQVTVKRQTHVEINALNKDALDRLQKSGVIWNDRKEKIISHQQLPKATASFLVRAKEDMMGLNKQQMLRDHFGLQQIHSIKHGVLWHVTADELDKTDLTEKLLQTNIMFNPYAHDCYHYSLS